MHRRLHRPLIAIIAGLAIAHATTAPVRSGELDYGDVSPQDIRMPTLFGNPEESVRKAEAALAGLRPTDDTNVMRKIGEILTWLCEARAALGQYTKAEAACLEAVATLERASEIDDIPESYSYELYTIALPQLANTYEEMGNHQAALTIRERLLTRLIGKVGYVSEKIALLIQIGELQVILGRFNAAEDSYLQAIAASTRDLQTDLHFLSQPYLNLAMLYHLQERFSEAETMLQKGIAKARETKERVTSEPTSSPRDILLHTFILQRLSQLLGWTYFYQGRLDEARDLAMALFDDYESAAEGWSWFASDALVLLGRIEGAETPGSPEAKRHLTSAVNASKGGDALANIFRAFAQRALARHHLLAGNVVAAEPYARVAVRSLDSWLSADHHETARARVALAKVLQNQGRYDEALTNAARAYATQQAYLPTYHSETGETLALLAELYAALGQQENLRATETLISNHAAARAKFESSL